MRKIPWAIWIAVVLGWFGGAAAEQPGLGAISFLAGVGILVLAYYAERLLQARVG